MPILEIKDLNVSLTQKKHRKKIEIQITKNIDFSVEEGECLCILGESGSGKSITIKSIMGLLPKEFNVQGGAIFDGVDLIKASKEEKREFRGKDITMILQNPMICFDPLYTIGSQMKETFKAHTELTSKEIQDESIKILEKMHIRNPKEVIKNYPHQISGGMLQRIMIGLAISMKPKLLIADEPTTAIDSITQFEIINEFLKLKEEKITMIFITHDLSVAKKIADKIIVMKDGEIVDRLSPENIKTDAKNIYTQCLVLQKEEVMNLFNKATRG